MLKQNKHEVLGTLGDLKLACLKKIEKLEYIKKILSDWAENFTQGASHGCPLIPKISKKCSDFAGNDLWKTLKVS